MWIHWGIREVETAFCIWSFVFVSVSGGPIMLSVIFSEINSIIHIFTCTVLEWRMEPIKYLFNKKAIFMKFYRWVQWSKKHLLQIFIKYITGFFIDFFLYRILLFWIRIPELFNICKDILPFYFKRYCLIFHFNRALST